MVWHKKEEGLDYEPMAAFDDFGLEFGKRDWLVAMRHSLDTYFCS